MSDVRHKEDEEFRARVADDKQLYLNSLTAPSMYQLLPDHMMVNVAPLSTSSN
jgi:hypothetical protein